MVKDFDPLEYQQRVFLGSLISKKHTFFKIIAKLGYEDAEYYSALEFWIWLDTHYKTTTLEEQLQKGIELLGMAHFLRNTKELTRLSMILGDTSKSGDM